MLLTELLAANINDKTLKQESIEERNFINVESALASWSDISLIFDFFQHFTQSEELDESDRIQVSRGLNAFLSDKFEENAPDQLYLNLFRTQSEDSKITVDSLASKSNLEN